MRVLTLSKEIFPRSEGLARLAYQFAEKYEKIGGRGDRKRPKELYSASPDCGKPTKVVSKMNKMREVFSVIL